MPPQLFLCPLRKHEDTYNTSTIRITFLSDSIIHLFVSIINIIYKKYIDIG